MTLKELRKELDSSIKSDRYTNAHKLKEDHNLKYSTKKIGKELATLAKNDPTIESNKVKGVWQYTRKAPEKVQSTTLALETISSASPTEKELTEKAELNNIISESKEEEMIQKAELKNIISGLKKEDMTRKAELKNIISELKDQHVDIPEVFFEAVKQRRDQLVQEYELLKEKAPTIAVQYDKMKLEIKIMRNKLRDYADLDQKMEANKMIKRFSEERKVRQGIMA